MRRYYVPALVLVLVVCTISVAFAGQPYVIKGKAFGSSITEFPNYERNCHEDYNWGAGVIGLKHCNDEDVQVGDLRLKEIKYDYINDKLMSVRLTEKLQPETLHYNSNTLATPLEKIISERFGNKLASGSFKPDQAYYTTKMRLNNKVVPGVKIKQIVHKENNVEVSVRRFYAYSQIEVNIVDIGLRKEYEATKIKSDQIQKQKKLEEEQNLTKKAIKDL